MKLEEIKLKTKDELEEIVIKFYESPYIGVYFSIKGQLDKLSKEIEDSTITIGEPKLFDSFLKWTEKSLVATNNLQEILAKIDSDILIEEKEKRLSAREGSVESFIKNR